MTLEFVRVRWHVGSNLFSGWMHEPEKKWRRNLKLLTGYKIVKPWIPVETHAMTATITTERDFLMRGIDRAYDGLTAGQQQRALEFMRVLHLANQVDPEATAVLMNSFHPSDKTDVNTAYAQLLKIVQSAVDGKLIKPAANDE